MRYLALASDYDGTLAQDGRVDDATVSALERFRASGRHLLLVTGRELAEVLEIFPKVTLFERVVAENGALLYNPSTKEERPLAEPPVQAFVDALHRRGVSPLSVGRAIVATWDTQQTKVLDAIRELGLELQMIFNKGALMVLPSGVNKASGLTAALSELCLSRHNTIGAGDAENDHAFLSICECAVAVGNSVRTLRERADLVTREDRGAGVAELIDRVLANDLADLPLERHDILLGHSDGEQVKLRPFGVNVLLCGPSGSGKSTLATAIMERLCECKYQYCVIDPEGDYQNLEGAVVIGDPKRGPTIDELLGLLAGSEQNVVANLLGIALEHRPGFFASLLPRFQEMRSRTGRPHWLVIDEAHHLLPAAVDPSRLTLPKKLDRTMMITVHPDQVSRAALASVDVVMAMGKRPDETLDLFRGVLGLKRPQSAPTTLACAEALAWFRKPDVLVRFRIAPPRGERHRHRRKYAEGELPDHLSFYFRGPKERLNLRAHNLMFFIQIAEGVDAQTWLHHLRRHDYSAWFHTAIKDPDLASAAEAIEKDTRLSAADSLDAIRKAILERYTLPARQGSNSRSDVAARAIATLSAHTPYTDSGSHAICPRSSISEP